MILPCQLRHKHQQFQQLLHKHQASMPLSSVQSILHQSLEEHFHDPVNKLKTLFSISLISFKHFSTV